MSVFKKNNAWIVRYRDLDGKQREKKAGATKTIALELERRILAERDTKKRFGYEKIEQITFSTLAEKYQKYSKIHKKPKTLLAQENALKTLLPMFGKKYLAEITEAGIDNYKVERAKKIANASLNRSLAFFKSALNKAVDWGYLLKAPKIQLLKSPPSRIRYLSKEEYSSLIKATLSEYTENAINFGLFSGMRKGEILALDIENIDIENELIHINDSKSGERRDIPISKKLLETINKVVGERKKGKLFDKGDFRKGFEMSVKRAGIDNFRFHDLRHTFASWLVISGVSIYVVKELLGHKNIEMTMRYAHLAPEQKRVAVNKCADFLLT